ncbi:MAG: hypothetical protein ACO329_00450 [Steroidobacteraceae bacterium]
MTQEAPATPDAPRGRAALIGLAALFFLPLLGSFYLYYIGGWRPEGGTNNGELISPALPLTAITLNERDGTTPSQTLLQDKWSLIYIGDGRCDKACQNALWTIRQTRLLLAEDMDRVQRIFIADEACCNDAFLEREHPGLEVITAEDDVTRQWLGQFPRDPAVPYVYIVDPLGNLMMRFDTRENPKGLLKDLEKLLKLSHIG